VDKFVVGGLGLARCAMTKDGKLPRALNAWRRKYACSAVIEPPNILSGIWSPKMKIHFNRFAKYVWGVLIFNLLVILWGAYVRASGSGAGCGSHWPLCNGEVIPQSQQIATLIEFTHRLSSGASLLLIIGLFIWAFRAYPKGHVVRLGASLSLVFIITEALIGAGLVLFKWVAKDASVGRVISISLHLINTFLLLASLSLTAWWSTGGKPVRLKDPGSVLVGLAIGLVGVLALGVTGAITALGDTLFPSSSLAEGFQQDFSSTAHFLVRLRFWHPLIAISVGLYLIFIAGLLGFLRSDQHVRRFVLVFVLLFLIQLGIGVTNLALLAPVWMQIIHLLFADLVWISLVLMAATTLSQSEGLLETAEEQRPLPYVDSHSTT
jgi:heme A synthase